MKDRKSIKFLASEVIKAEEELHKNKNVKQNKEKIEQIISKLSVPEILELNDYVIAYFKI